MTPLARTGIIYGMPLHVRTPVEVVTDRICALARGARVLVVPRDLRLDPLDAIEWELRPRPRQSSIDFQAHVTMHAREAADETHGDVRVAVEGVCRVTEGGDRFGGKSTCVVVHVIADGEPARVVLVPTEGT